MDKTSGSSFRATPAAGGTPQNQDPAPGHDKPPGDLCVPRHDLAKVRLLPPGLQEAAPPRELDCKSVFMGGLATMTGQGLCFGTAVATLNHLRLGSKAYPRLNYAVAALLPPLTGYLTAPAQAHMYRVLDYKATQMPQASIVHDAIPSATLWAIYRGWAAQAFVPKPSPGTPGAAAVSVMLSMIGTGLAGAGAEAIAQWAGGQAAPLPDDEEVHLKGLGRAVALMPMAAGTTKAVSYVLRLGKVPNERQGDILKLALGGWIARNKITDTMKALQSSPVAPGTRPSPDGAAQNEPSPDDNT